MVQSVDAAALAVQAGATAPAVIDPAEARHFSGYMVHPQASDPSSLQSLSSAADQFFGQRPQASEAIAQRMVPAADLSDPRTAAVEFGQAQMEIVKFSNDSMTYFSKMHLGTALASACSNQFNSLLKNNG
jgi:hypothetical protein